jgi:hypothetical protein
MDEKPEARPMGQVIQMDEARMRDYLGEMVRATVEEALNAVLDVEADQLCGARRSERRRDAEEHAGRQPWANAGNASWPNGPNLRLVYL